MNNIILIGMPSCGKSTVGVILAKQLGYRFTDSDLLIQESEGKLLCELIEQNGIDGFLDIENRVNCSIECENSVISTGGSVVYCDEAMRHLKSIGKVIYINISYDDLVRRLGDFTHRGVVMKNGFTLADMYDEREKLYKKYADITVDIKNGESISDTSDRLMSVISEAKIGALQKA